MKDIEIKSLFRDSEKYADQEITVRGWVRTNRGSNKFGFIELNDGILSLFDIFEQFLVT